MSVPKGTKFTSEHRKHLSEALTGRKMPGASRNLGQYSTKGFKWESPRTEENRAKVRHALIGKPLSEERKRKISEATKGRVPWNKGLKHSEETKRKIGLKSLGRKPSEKALQMHRLRLTGVNNPSWRGGITFDPGYNALQVRKRRIRKLSATGFHSIEEWNALKKAYNYTCLSCKRQEPEITLTEDHILPLSKGGTDFIDNIQPLCKLCNSTKNTKTIDYRNGAA